MLRKIFIALAVLGCIAAATWWFSYIRKVRAPVSDAINAIPQDAGFILEFSNSAKTWKKISETSIMWEELLSTSTFAHLNYQAGYIDSLLQVDPRIYSILEGHPVFISAHRNSEKELSFLFTYSLPNLTFTDDVNNFLRKVNNNTEPAKTMTEGVQIMVVQPRLHPPLYLCMLNGTLIMSADKALAARAVHQLLSGTSITADKSFAKVFSTAGRNVDANLYVNFRQLPALSARWLSKDVMGKVENLRNFASFTAWDITLKPNAVMMSGFTAAQDSMPQLLGLFRNQKPQTITLPDLLPAHTAMMLWSGFSNYGSYRQERKKKFPAASDALHVDTDILEWCGNELALVITTPESDDLTDNFYAVIQVADTAACSRSLSAISATSTEPEKQKQEIYRGHIISNAGIPGLVPTLFGNEYARIDGSYYALLGPCIVFGNSAAAMHAYIDELESHKFLGNDRNYKSFAENISTEANIYLYSSISAGTGLFRSWLDSSCIADFDRQIPLTRKFESLALQFSSGPDLFFSNFYLRYNPEQKEDPGTLWELQLDTTFSSRPLLLINHNTKGRDVFVQDDANKIYLISNTGKIIWTKQLDEKIMSSVIQVDVLKNEKLQMVFNTRSKIYMYDRNGNEMKGFPIMLPSPATSPLTVIDYEKNRNYRIFIALEDLRILCFDPVGEEVKGFHAPKTKDAVYLPVQYFTAANKDYLCAVDVNGQIYLYNRRGEMRVRLHERMPPGIRNFFTETGKDNNRTFIIAADTLGTIYKVNLADKKEKTNIQQFESSPYFDFRDINNDKQREYIFGTRNKLMVFGPDRSMLFNYDFPDSVNSEVQFFIFPEGKIKFGICSETAGRIYLLNENGIAEDGFPRIGRTPFSIADLNNDGVFYLVTGGPDKSIYVYQVE